MTTTVERGTWSSRLAFILAAGGLGWAWGAPAALAERTAERAWFPALRLWGVYNERGAVELEASVEDSTLEGVVTMPHGYWGSLLRGGSSANALTPDGLADLGGGGSFYDTRVEVRKTG